MASLELAEAAWRTGGRLVNGRRVDALFEADISVILQPLPKVPQMICYWKPEEGMASSLHLFFDESAPDNPSIGDIFSLGAGLSQMFTKLALRHGFVETAGDREDKRKL